MLPTRRYNAAGPGPAGVETCPTSQAAMEISSRFLSPRCRCKRLTGSTSGDAPSPISREDRWDLDDMTFALLRSQVNRPIPWGGIVNWVARSVGKWYGEREVWP